MRQRIQKWRTSKKLTSFVVAFAIFIDNLILTVIVPILPVFLYSKQVSNQFTNITALHTSHLNTLARKLDYDSVHQRLMAQSTEDGFLLASKPLVQLIANPFVGSLIPVVGYIKSMFIGFIVMFISTLLFAFGESYAILFIARAVQGIGSSCSTVAGFAFLADIYRDDNERVKAMTIAFSGLTFGQIVGLPFGGLMYEYFDKTTPYLCICVLTIIDGCLLLFIVQPDSESKKEVKSPSLITLAKDPYILLIAGGIFVINLGFAVLQTGLPIWMMDKMDASRWQLGFIFLPDNVSYLIGVNLFRPLLSCITRGLAAIIGLLAMGISLLMVPAAQTIAQLIIPIAVLGLACGLVELALFPELGRLVDVKYSSVYGNVYAIGDVALCLGYGIGPILCGLIMNVAGFEKTIMLCAILQVVYSPLLCFLRKVTKKTGEKTPLIENKYPNGIQKKAMSYENFQ